MQNQGRRQKFRVHIQIDYGLCQFDNEQSFKILTSHWAFAILFHILRPYALSNKN